jgi:hypothetical protein
VRLHARIGGPPSFAKASDDKPKKLLTSNPPTLSFGGQAFFLCFVIPAFVPESHLIVLFSLN